MIKTVKFVNDFESVFFASYSSDYEFKSNGKFERNLELKKCKWWLTRNKY